MLFLSCIIPVLYSTRSFKEEACVVDNTQKSCLLNLCLHVLRTACREGERGVGSMSNNSLDLVDGFPPFGDMYNSFNSTMNALMNPS